MKEKNRQALAAILVYLAFLGLVFTKSNEKEKITEQTSIETLEDNHITHYEIPSEEYVINSINNLGIQDESIKPSNIYKVIEFKDNNGFYKIMIVNIEVMFNTNDGEIIGQTYLVKDAFTKTELFYTKDFSEIISLNDKFDSADIISCSKLEKLKQLALFNGAPKEYVESFKFDGSLNDDYVGELYVTFINESNRVNSNDLENSKVKTIG